MKIATPAPFEVLAPASHPPDPRPPDPRKDTPSTGLLLDACTYLGCEPNAGLAALTRAVDRALDDRDAPAKTLSACLELFATDRIARADVQRLLRKLVGHPKADDDLLWMTASELPRMVRHGTLDREGVVRIAVLISTHPGVDSTCLWTLQRAIESVRATQGWSDLFERIEAALIEHPEYGYAGRDFALRSWHKTVTGTGAQVTTGSPHATWAATRILENPRANAFDAAAAAVLAYYDDVNTGLGGRGNFIAHADGETFACGAMTQNPQTVPAIPEGEKRKGWGMVPVPGVPALVAKLMERGNLTLEEVAAPAIELADNGFHPGPHLRQVIAKLKKRLPDNYKTHDGRAPKRADTLSNPALAETLRELAAGGADAFYRGPIGERFVADARRGGASITMEDLAAYQAKDVPILEAKLGGYTIKTMGGNTWGHTLIQLINMASRLELGGAEADLDQTLGLVFLLAMALAKRPQTLGDLSPKNNGIDLDTLASADFAAECAEWIASTLSRRDSIAEAFEKLTREMGKPEEQGDHDTTHFVVTGPDGDMVSCTLSLGRHGGARVTSESTGITGAQQYELNHVASPTGGTLATTEQTPVLVFAPDGTLIGTGAAGSERIPQAVFDVLLNIILREYDPTHAVSAARLTVKNFKVRAHFGFPSRLLVALKKLGLPLDLIGRSHNHNGIVQLLARRADGTSTSVADPAYDGTAGKVERDD